MNDSPKTHCPGFGTFDRNYLPELPLKRTAESATNLLHYRQKAVQIAFDDVFARQLQDMPNSIEPTGGAGIAVWNQSAPSDNPTPSRIIRSVLAG